MSPCRHMTRFACFITCNHLRFRVFATATYSSKARCWEGAGAGLTRVFISNSPSRDHWRSARSLSNRAPTKHNCSCSLQNLRGGGGGGGGGVAYWKKLSTALVILSDDARPTIVQSASTSPATSKTTIQFTFQVCIKFLISFRLILRTPCNNLALQ